MRDAREAKLDLDHAVAMVLDKTRQRYAQFLAMPEVVEKFEELNQTAANIVGINRWLDKVTGQTHECGDAAAAR